MSSLIIQDSTLTDIADAIRLKTGSNSTMTPSQMAAAVNSISTSSGYSLSQIANRQISGEFVYPGSAISQYAFCDCVGITSVVANSVTSMGDGAFGYLHDSVTEQQYLASVEMNSLLTIPQKAFYAQTNLSHIEFEQATVIGPQAFEGCQSLIYVYLPICRTIKSAGAFRGSGVQTVILPSVTFIANQSFQYCNNLSTLVIGSSTMCTIGNNAFANSSFTNVDKLATNNIYVPNDLILSYQSSNWSALRVNFLPIENSIYAQYKQTT